LRRLRTERVRELLVFEDWEGDVRALLPVLRDAGVPVRLLPALRDALPVEGALDDFMGWPALRLGAQAAGRAPSNRVGAFGAAALLGLVGLAPFVLWAAGRALSGRRLLEPARLRGRAGALLKAPRTCGIPEGRGFATELVRWLPSLPLVASGRLGLVGVHPFPDEAWPLLDEDYRAKPPDAPAGIFGPWTSRRLSPAQLRQWNRRYAREWSPAEDFRIFWRAVFGLRQPTGD
jgi:hypothetical protein